MCFDVISFVWKLLKFYICSDCFQSWPSLEIFIFVLQLLAVYVETYRQAYLLMNIYITSQSLQCRIGRIIFDKKLD